MEMGIIILNNAQADLAVLRRQYCKLLIKNFNVQQIPSVKTNIDEMSDTFRLYVIFFIYVSVGHLRQYPIWQVFHR